MAALHLPGPVLVGPQEERPGAWVVDGRITYDAPSGAVGDRKPLPGGCFRGWSTPTATSGSTPTVRWTS